MSNKSGKISTKSKKKRLYFLLHGRLLKINFKFLLTKLNSCVRIRVYKRLYVRKERLAMTFGEFIEMLKLIFEAIVAFFSKKGDDGEGTEK